MNIEECIEAMLEAGETVYLPGFGTLIPEYISASIHPVQHLFSPPQKRCSFSPDFNNVDLKLVERVASINNISMDEAKKSVDEFIDEIKRSLKDKGAFVVNSIGKFYLDIEKKLRFAWMPSRNFLTASYGLPEFISKPVLHPENIPAYTPSPVKQERKKRRFIWFRF